ncbi:LysR family transcriptional regulator [Paraburkholderia dipogonis]|uniref:LysR family transcriptional regulator n=1 Tax=Paraburkholderia dipogonis TaxID=1211383 RepID=UPI0038B80DC1
MLNSAYRYFYAVALEGSIRRAAERVHISASALSRQVRLLESEFGQALIEHHGRRIVLTSAGNILREHIRQLMLQDAAVKDAIRTSNGLQFGHVKVASGNGYVSDLADVVIPEFLECHPQMTYGIDIGNGDAVLRMVIDEVVDIGITMNPPQHHLIKVVHSAPPLLVVLPLGHALSEAESLSLNNLQQFAIGLLPSQHRIRQSIKVVEDAVGIKLHPVLESNSYEILKSLVKNRLAITILPEFAIKTSGWESVFKLIPLQHERLAQTTSGIIARQGRAIPESVMEFVNFVIARHNAFSSRPS